MAKVTLTANLKKYFPHRHLEVDGETVLAVLRKMDEIRPHFSSYILEDDAAIRRHVNIFIDGSMLRDKSHVNVPVGEHTQIHIMQALSGG